MTSRERVLASINHQQPDKMAVDFGGTVVSTMHVRIIEQLREHFGLPKQPVVVNDVYTMVGVVDHELQGCLGTDVTMAMPRTTGHGFSREEFKEWTTPHGQTVLVQKDFVTSDDGRGGLFTHPQGDLSAPPSGHMPKGAYYFDAVIRAEKVQKENLNPVDNLEEIQLLSGRDMDYIVKRVEDEYATGRAVAFAMPGMGLGDVADIPGCALKHPKGIRSLEEWYVAPLRWPDYVMAVFEKQTEIALQNLKTLYDAVGDKIQVLHTCGTDHAHQKGTFLSNKTFEKIYLPYYKKANDWIHQNTGWKIFKHNCGAVEPLIPLLIESGFDILNPVQCSAKGMDPRHLKDTYGRDITFWGAGVDTQFTLPFGTPAEIRREVLERCEIFAPGGGFVFNTIHNIQADIPIENVLAVINAVKEFNGEKPV